jgi:hypothetical protein
MIAMLATLLPLALLASGEAPAVSTSSPERAAVSPELSEVLSRGLTVPGARVFAAGFTPPLPQGCAPRAFSLAQPVTGSARVAVRLHEPGCPHWAWLRVEVWARVAVTTRPVRMGESLDEALAFEEREVRSGHVPWLPAAGARAKRDLPRGAIIEPPHVAGVTLTAGATVKVVVTTGALAVETQGRAVGCGPGRACAVLPSGRHVEGRLENGCLFVEVP